MPQGSHAQLAIGSESFNPRAREACLRRVEMTKLIEKARNSSSAYEKEKRSEYGERDGAKSDLNMATRLDPTRTYPYRYRAAGEPPDRLTSACTISDKWS